VDAAWERLCKDDEPEAPEAPRESEPCPMCERLAKYGTKCRKHAERGL